MKGGHGNSGPAPDPNAMRRDRASDLASWVTLPESGREGLAPAWPLPRPTAPEKRMWEREWQRPQAVMWERLGLGDEVALYVRTFIRAQAKDAAATLIGRAMQLQESLGLSTTGLARRRWTIGGATQQQRQQATGTEGKSARARLTALKGGRDA